MSDLEVFTVQELAVRWRVSRQTLMEAIHAGRLLAFRIGAGGKARYRITRTEVARFESERANQPVAANDTTPAPRARRAGGR